MNERPILIIDALNLFSRHYVRNPSMSTHGHQAGGIVGFLSSLAYMINLMQPESVIIAWEGGGSSRRRAIFPGYKANRRPPRLNRYYEADIPDSKENRVQQIKFLVDVLKTVPVIQIFVDDCEADDVIGYLCRNRFRNVKKFIASSDRDFYQLLDDKTTIYSLSAKQFIGPKEVKEQFNISPVNFVLAKAVVGDASDGIPGVKGVGFKTIAKRFELVGDIMLTVNELLEACAHRDSKSPKIYSQIYENEVLIKRNWRLMYLDVSNLAAVQVRKIDAAIESFRPNKNKMQLMRSLINEGLGSFDAHDFFSAFASFK